MTTTELQKKREATTYKKDRKGRTLPPPHLNAEQKARWMKSATKKAAAAENRSAGKGDMRGRWTASEDYRSEYERIFGA